MPIGVVVVVEDRHCEYKIVKIFPNLAGIRRTAADAIFGSPTEILAVLGLPDTHYFDPWFNPVSVCTCGVWGKV